jgi:hypothetical protein
VAFPNENVGPGTPPFGNWAACASPAPVVGNVNLPGSFLFGWRKGLAVASFLAKLLKIQFMVLFIFSLFL